MILCRYNTRRSQRVRVDSNAVQKSRRVQLYVNFPRVMCVRVHLYFHIFICGKNLVTFPHYSMRIKLEGFSIGCIPAPLLHASYSKVLTEETTSQNV